MKEKKRLEELLRKNKYFDHIIGQQNHQSSPDDIKLLKRIIKAHSEDYSEDDKMNFERIGLHLRMKRYLAEPVKQIKPVGEFLNELLEIYKVKRQNLLNSLIMKTQIFMPY